VQHAKQTDHRRDHQVAVEKQFKVKQAKDACVSKARDKYKGDCIRIISYTQQSTFAQGKDLERIQAKLKRAQLTVQANERDFASFTHDLLDFLPEWELGWKNFCDACQDLEEDRMDFMRDILWTYANQVSTICVSDDEVRCLFFVMGVSLERDTNSLVSGYEQLSNISERSRTSWALSTTTDKET
jgi:hypothetical protein